MADEQIGGEIPGGNTPGADRSNPNTNTNTQSGGGQQPVGGGNQERTYSYREDRTDWVPQYRLKEVTGKYEKDLQALKSRLEEQDKRVKSVFGINEKSAAEAEREEIKREILSMIKPEDVGGLSKEQVERLTAAAERAERAERKQWETLAGEMLGQVETNLAKSVGSDKLTPTQQRRVRAAYIAECQLAMQEREAAYEAGQRQSLDTTRADNDFLARHERGDKQLVTEFVKAFADDFIEPARRLATAATLRRQRPVPSGERTGLVASKQPEINVNDEAAFKNAMAEGLRSRRG